MTEYSDDKYKSLCSHVKRETAAEICIGAGGISACAGLCVALHYFPSVWLQVIIGALFCLCGFAVIFIACELTLPKRAQILHYRALSVVAPAVVTGTISVAPKIITKQKHITPYRIEVQTPAGSRVLYINGFWLDVPEPSRETAFTVRDNYVTAYEVSE